MAKALGYPVSEHMPEDKHVPTQVVFPRVLTWVLTERDRFVPDGLSECEMIEKLKPNLKMPDLASCFRDSTQLSQAKVYELLPGLILGSTSTYLRTCIVADFMTLFPLKSHQDSTFPRAKAINRHH
jgi:hypothetical protein